MNNDELRNAITALDPTLLVEEGNQWPVIHADVAGFKTLASTIRMAPGLLFDYLFCLTCIDWKSHLTMVYHLDSTTYRHNVVLKVKLSIVSPSIDTVTDIWKTALFHEREVYEMFGVQFIGHPDLRLLILPDGWEGKNPMLKDFEDPVNMIRL